MKIGVYGHNGSGKDTVSEIIANKLNYKHLKFAALPAYLVYLITGVDYLSLNREEKETFRPSLIQFAENCKKIFGEDIWAIQLKHETNAVISDLRFEAEYEIVDIKIRIIKDNIPGLLDDKDFDFTIHNNGTLAELEEAANQIADELINRSTIKKNGLEE